MKYCVGERRSSPGPRILVEVHHAAALEQISNWVKRYRYSTQWRIPAQGFPRMLFAWPSEAPPDL